MTATTTDRNSPAAYLQRQGYAFLATNAVVPAGVIVAVNTAGLIPTAGSSDAPGLVVMGRSEHAADEAEGDDRLTYSRGVYGFAMTSALLAAASANIGRTVYLEDNQTVGLASDTVNQIPVGKLELVEDGRAYVSVGLDSGTQASSLSGGSAGNVANLAVAPAETSGGIPVIIAIDIPDAATATYVYENTDKIEIIDVWNIKDGAGAANTIQVTDIADAAITNAMAAAVDKTVTRAGTIDKAKRVLAAGAGFKVVATRAAGTMAAQLFILAIKRA